MTVKIYYPNGSGSYNPTDAGNADTWGGRKTYVQASAPIIGSGNAQAGDEWYDTTNNIWKYCNGTNWVQAGASLLNVPNAWIG